MDYIYYSLLRIPGILIAITLHEVIRAYLSTRFGDPIPRREGRLTLNPFKHLDIIGLLIFVTCGYGWGKPVNTTSLYYKNKKRDTVLTYALPILANALCFALCLIIVIIAAKYDLPRNFTNSGRTSITLLILLHIARSNFALAFINLIPVYPMGASKVLSAFLSPKNVVKYSKYSAYMQVALALLIFSGFLNNIMYPVEAFFSQILMNLVG